jgi:LAO/AO transport system kinase
MATRGYLGGLSRATNDAIDLMDAAGYDPVFVETVGVGQDEVDVVKTADVVAVVLVPGMGDDIQAIKAGILEIADLFVINKSDHQGADRLHTELEYMLSMVDSADKPKPTIHHTVATSDLGVADLWSAVTEKLRTLRLSRPNDKRRERAEARFLAVLSDRLLDRVKRDAFPDDDFERIVSEIADRSIDPYSAAEEILRRLEIR